MKLSELDSLARRQHGVVARRQTSLTSSSWQRWTTNGRLVPIHDGIARLVGTPDCPEQRIMAGVLVAGKGAVASHRSAAYLHGIPVEEPPPVDVIVRSRPSDTTRKPRASGLRVVRSAEENVEDRQELVRIHRPRDLGRLAPHRIDGIACTNVLRTLLDLGAVDADAVHGAVGHCLTNRLATFGAIESALDQHARPGRNGVRALRSALGDWAIDAKPADSVLEPAMKRLVGNYGLPPVEFHPHVGGREVDFRIVGTPIVIECDGWQYHGRDKDQFERDRAGDAEFTAHGWIVLRFTYRRITTRPADVARQIRSAVARWTGHPAPDAA